MFFLAIFLQIFSCNSFAQPTYQLRLGSEDSIEFVTALAGFVEDKEVQDPEYPEVYLKKKVLTLKDEAVQFSCLELRTKRTDADNFDEVEQVDCVIQFRPERSNDEVDVFVLSNQVLVAKIYDANVVDRLFKNLGQMPYISVGRFLFSKKPGLGDMPRLKLECEADFVHANRARYCTVVATATAL